MTKEQSAAFEEWFGNNVGHSPDEDGLDEIYDRYFDCWQAALASQRKPDVEYVGCPFSEDNVEMETIEVTQGFLKAIEPIEMDERYKVLFYKQDAKAGEG
jgi:hypothetical protein